MGFRNNMATKVRRTRDSVDYACLLALAKAVDCVGSRVHSSASERQCLDCMHLWLRNVAECFTCVHLPILGWEQGNTEIAHNCQPQSRAGSVTTAHGHWRAREQENTMIIHAYLPQQVSGGALQPPMPPASARQQGRCHNHSPQPVLARWWENAASKFTHLC